MILVTEPKLIKGKAIEEFVYKLDRFVTIESMLYVIPADIAFDFEILAITATVDEISYEVMFGSGVAPASIFTERADLHFPSKAMRDGDEIIVEVRNKSPGERAFNASFVGRE